MKRPRVTLLLVILNVLAFAWMAFHQQNIWFNRNVDFLFMLKSGANFNPFVVRGEYWRLFASMFLHWGILHLAVNMYALYGIGKLLEGFLGPLRLALFYLITGLAASVSSLYFNVYSVSAGASGAIFGLYGYMIMQQVLANFSNRQALRSIAFNFVIFVVVNYAISKQVNVDNAGHIGGFVAGASLCLLNFFGFLIQTWQQVALLVLIPLSVLFVPRHQLHYYEIYSQVAKAGMRLESVNGQLLTDDQRADSLSNDVLPLFDTALVSLGALEKVPPRVAPDTSILRQRVLLQKDMIKYQLLGIEKETFIYRDTVEYIMARLDSLPALEFRLGYEIDPRLLESITQSAAQQSGAEFAKVYYDSTWREIPTEYGASYYRLGWRDSLDRWQGNVQDYYIEGNIQMKGKYLNNMHDGIFRYYARDGTYESLGRYAKERPVGKWENYHANGLLESEVYYGNGSFTRTVFDSLGNQQVADGNGRVTTWHANGRTKEEGEYIDGRKQGTWLGYYASGKGHFQELYRDGLLVRGVALDEKGERYVYDQLSVFPFPEMGMPAYKEYLASSIRRHDQSKSHSGTVELTFLVQADGHIQDFVVMKSLCPQCDREAMRLVEEGPPWRPGVLRGHVKIPSNGQVEVLF